MLKDYHKPFYKAIKLKEKSNANTDSSSKIILGFLLTDCGLKSVITEYLTRP